jgi:hypothetical protein
MSYEDYWNQYTSQEINSMYGLEQEECMDDECFETFEKIKEKEMTYSITTLSDLGMSYRDFL